MTATTYTYTTGCSTNDDFASDDLSTCWTATPSAAVGTYSIGSGRLNFALTATTSSSIPPYVAKGFASSDTPTITVQVPVFTNFITGDEACDLMILDSASLGANPTGVAVKVSSVSGSVLVKASATNGDSQVNSPALGVGTTNVAVTGTISIRLTRTASAVEFLYSTDGATFTSITTIATTGSAALGTSPIVAIMAEDMGTSSPTCGFDNFTVTGATAISPLYEY